MSGRGLVTERISEWEGLITDTVSEWYQVSELDHLIPLVASQDMGY